MILILLFIVPMQLILTGCQKTLPAPSMQPESNSFQRPVIALVLGGGAARGFAHIGVIRVLEQEKIPIQMIVGTSIGSLIGAIYADCQNSFELEWMTHDVKEDDFFDFSVWNSLMGPFEGDKIEEFIQKSVKAKRIEELKIHYAAIATDLHRGKKVILKSGPVATAVRASCAIPGLFHPVQIGNQLLSDGGIVDNVPVDVAKEMGADIVIAVDISRDVEKGEISNFVVVTIQAISIMAREIGKCQADKADILIAPEVGKINSMDFDNKKECIKAGIDAATAAIPSIKETIARWHQTYPSPAQY
ncbi:MAG: patatin-like phospholipase family protein [Acidobacteriota bacterium]